LDVALEGKVVASIPWILKTKGACLIGRHSIDYTPDGIIGMYAVGLYYQKNEIRIVGGKKELYLKLIPPYIGLFLNKDSELRTIRKAYQAGHRQARQGDRGIQPSPRSRARSLRRKKTV
jgi:hypothetical protein